MASNINTGECCYSAIELYTTPRVIVYGSHRDCRRAVNGAGLGAHISNNRTLGAAQHAAEKAGRSRSLPCKSVADYFAEGGKDGGI